MSREKFWRWYDRAARADFAGTLLGYIFDWKTWIVTAFGGGGGIATFFAAVGNWSPLLVWVFAAIVAASLAATAYFVIRILETRREMDDEPRSESQPSQNVGEFDGDIPDVRVADDPVVGALFAAPHHDKLLPLLERGRINAWGRLGNGRPPLTLIPADEWRTHYLLNIPSDGPGRINQTYFRSKARTYEGTYYDVYLNRSQVERAWPGLWQQPSNGRIPCTELLTLAANAGWDFTSRDSVQLVDLQDAMRQGGSDRTLVIWGRENKWKTESRMRSELLEKISPDHWKTHFVHLFAAKQGDNFNTYSWSPSRNDFGRRGYVDLHVNWSQATSWLGRDALPFKGKNNPR
jgi:hypothetical protein